MEATDPTHPMPEPRMSLGALFEAMSPHERRTIARLLRRTTVSRNVNVSYGEQLTLGERLADRVAAFGGSWRFIILFFAFLFGWSILNTVVLMGDAFDPYPFVFLNLVLSMLAAIQAPIIMMSQNRQAAKDRIAAEHDYEVNLKAEVEVMALHEKLDQSRIADLVSLVERQGEEIRALRTAIETRIAPAP